MSGSDNSQIFELCADGHRCENGSKCTENFMDEGAYYCDCSKIAQGDSYAGLYCEHRATEYCTLRQEISRDFFCTNGGTCKASVTNSEAHLGCDCPDKYEGPHCQFTQGTAPKDWPYNGEKQPEDLYGYPDGFGGRASDGLSGGITALIVLIALGVVATAGFFMMKRCRRLGRGKEDPFADPSMSAGIPSSNGSLPTPDLALDADGGVLVEAIEGTTTNGHDNGSFEDVKINTSTEEEGSGEII